MQQAVTSQSRFKRLEIKTLESRVKSLHTRLTKELGDPNYDQGLGYTWKIARKLSDYEILSAADYCKRKSTHPGKAFVGLCEKKLANDS